MIDGKAKLDLAAWCKMATWMQGKAETCAGDAVCEGILDDSINYFQARCEGQEMLYPFAAIQKR